jgi:hypothetical protein
VASALQFGLQLGEVLEDAVVDDRQIAVGVLVGMGIAVAGLTVRGPPRVANARRAVEPCAVQRLTQVRELAGPFDDPDAQVAVAGEDRDPRGVVPAVLQRCQPADEDVGDRLGARVADDAAHCDHLP